MVVTSVPRPLAEEVAVIPADAIQAGRQIYREGVMGSGQPVQGTVLGDVVLEGAQVQCAACHRRSGFGTSEGGALVPPIVAPWLFGQDPPGRADLFSKLYQEVQPGRVRAKLRAQQIRPPYSDDSLAVALRTGRDPSGRELDSTMPRYPLSDEAMGHLIAYLRSLGTGDDPGVDETTVHFATVLTPNVSSTQRRAMLEVMNTYFEWKNGDTEGQRQRLGHSPWHRDDFYRALRRWQLHVWELEGPASTWLEQLQERYEQRPVFALLSGLGFGDWAPVHDFCERQEVPCVFPNAEPPPNPKAGDYALYFSRGVTLEAEALAHYLVATEPSSRVVQLYREGGRSQEAAEAFSRALTDVALTGVGHLHLESRAIGSSPIEWAELWAGLLAEEPGAVWVLWLAEVDLEALAEAARMGRETVPFEQILLSYTMLGEELLSLPSGLPGKVRLTWPYALPGREAPRIYRVRAWMRSRKLPRDHERLRLKTYFALSIADHAIDHLVESFSRDYFIENIEHEAENTLNPGVYPRLSLGPGQRFASKGCTVVQLTEDGVEPVSDWIVP